MKIFSFMSRRAISSVTMLLKDWHIFGRYWAIGISWVDIAAGYCMARSHEGIARDSARPQLQVEGDQALAGGTPGLTAIIG